jgi:hypothetical protein
VLYEGKDPLLVVSELMERGLKHELEYDPEICMVNDKVGD